MNIDTYRMLIERNFPQVTIWTMRPITRGWDSFVLDINDELIFRFPLREDVVEYLQKEMCLLPVLAQTLSTPVPHFTYIGRGNDNYPFPFVGYQKLNGMALEDERITSEHLIALASALSTFLSELHGFSVAEAIQAGMQKCEPLQWRERYQERYLDLRRRVFPLLDAELCEKSEHLWENFLKDETLFAFQPVLIHADLACEHIFCNPEQGMLTGVIDWGDATIGDPALDFVGLHRRYGRAFIERILKEYQSIVDVAFWQRVDFYLQYKPFAELLYGAYCENEQFTEQGMANLHAMFKK